MSTQCKDQTFKYYANISKELYEHYPKLHQFPIKLRLIHFHPSQPPNNPKFLCLRHFFSILSDFCMFNNIFPNNHTCLKRLHKVPQVPASEVVDNSSYMWKRRTAALIYVREYTYRWIFMQCINMRSRNFFLWFLNSVKKNLFLFDISLVLCSLWLDVYLMVKKCKFFFHCTA